MKKATKYSPVLLLSLYLVLSNLTPSLSSLGSGDQTAIRQPRYDDAIVGRMVWYTYIT